MLGVSTCATEELLECEDHVDSGGSNSRSTLIQVLKVWTETVADSVMFVEIKEGEIDTAGLPAVGPTVVITLEPKVKPGADAVMIVSPAR